MRFLVAAQAPRSTGKTGKWKIDRAVVSAPRITGIHFAEENTRLAGGSARNVLGE